MWTHADDYTILANLNVRSIFKDGVFKWYELYPVDGYVLRIHILDEYQIDEEGNFVFDENGNKILVTPYRSYGGAMVMPNYDFTTNPNGYCAELYEEGMIVFGVPEDKPEVM